MRAGLLRARNMQGVEILESHLHQFGQPRFDRTEISLYDLGCRQPIFDTSEPFSDRISSVFQMQGTTADKLNSASLQRKQR
jgi:hypothetical protein